MPIFLAYTGKTAAISEAQLDKYLHNDNLWKIPTRFRGALFNYIQRKAIVWMNTQMHKLAKAYNIEVLRHRYGGFENNAVLLRQQKIVGGKLP